MNEVLSQWKDFNRWEFGILKVKGAALIKPKMNLGKSNNTLSYQERYIVAITKIKACCIPSLNSQPLVRHVRWSPSPRQESSGHVH